MSEELKPCPFCGNSVGIKQTTTMPSTILIWWVIRCGFCGCSLFDGKFKSKEEAIKAWNTRAETKEFFIPNDGKICHKMEVREDE